MMQNANKSGLNFLIDYSDADLPWVEWIAWQLEDANYTVQYRQRDFLPGTNIVQKTEQAITIAEHLLVILSPDYLKAYHEKKTFSGIPVWTPELFKDSSRKKRKIIPIRVRKCRPQGLLAPIISIDIFELNELEARNMLLNGVSKERPPRSEKPVFPGTPKSVTKENRSKPGFPPLYRPPIWHVPHDNPFFTDREHELTQIYAELTAGTEGRIHTHVINGLGGVGKTQVALAYAHSYKHLYETVLWIDASTQRSLVSSIVDLADTLKLVLSRSERQNDQKVISAMRQWLEGHPNWLLILDNIEDFMARDLIPSVGNGHILFTARMQATGTNASSTIHLNELNPEDSALLLLKRAKRIKTFDTLENTTESARAIALKLSSMLGNLPLMLDQAGAYIDEANIDLSVYLNYYGNTRLRRSLLQRRGDMTNNHRESVSETWNHSFEIVQQTNPAAYDLLCFCAFLFPNDIPEEIITEGAAKLLPTLQSFAFDPLQKDQAVVTLRKHSLLDQNTLKKTFIMNHMVQIVLRDKMNDGEQIQWIRHVITALHYTLENTKLPDAGSSLAEYCLRYFLHVEACAYHMKDQNFTSIEAARLLHRMGRYLHDYAHYVSHEPSLPLQLEHTHIVSTLESYSILLKQMQLLSEAEELTLYADSIRAVFAT